VFFTNVALLITKLTKVNITPCSPRRPPPRPALLHRARAGCLTRDATQGTLMLYAVCLDRKVPPCRTRARILRPRRPFAFSRIYIARRPPKPKLLFARYTRPQPALSRRRSRGHSSASSSTTSRRSRGACPRCDGLLTPHTSHLTPHTSHLTPHTSHPTSHTLHLTHHTSHLAPHTSHLTPHTSHLTPHTSHLTPHTSHLTPHTSHLTPHTPHLTPHTSHPTPRTPHPAPRTLKPPRSSQLARC
jgi:hypothetical protein